VNEYIIHRQLSPNLVRAYLILQPLYIKPLPLTWLQVLVPLIQRLYLQALPERFRSAGFHGVSIDFPSIHRLFYGLSAPMCPKSPHFLTRWVSRLLWLALVSWAFARVGVHRLSLRLTYWF